MFGLFGHSYICCMCGERKSGAELVYKNSCICDDCFAKLETTPENSMFGGQWDIDFLPVPFYYTDEYRRAFLNFKFGGNIAIGHLLGLACGRYFKRHSILSEYDCMVPVPLTKKGERRRGFNQAELLAEYFSAACGVPLDRALRRNGEKAPQSTLSGAERMRNVVDAFEVCGDVRGMRVLIADDLFTTGSTMNECARMLKSAGAVCAAGLAAACGKSRLGVTEDIDFE